MKRFVFLLAPIALALAPTSFAQISVIGSGLGKDCYTAVKYSKTTPRKIEDICTRALTSGQLNRDNRAATLVNRGIIRMRVGRYDAALKDYASAERLRDGNGPLYLNRGAALIYKKQFSDALDSLNLAIELETQDLFAAYYNRGIAKERTGDVRGAYYDFKKSLELNPEFEAAQWQLDRFTVTEG